jgi:flagellar basal body-associated protein FliL
MNKLDDLISAAKLNEFLNKKQEPEKKKCNVVVCVLAVIGVIAAVAAIAYAVYRYFTPEYLEDFEDEFEDEFDDEEPDDEEDDFFVDEGEN